VLPVVKHPGLDLVDHVLHIAAASPGLAAGADPDVSMLTAGVDPLGPAPFHRKCGGPAGSTAVRVRARDPHPLSRRQGIDSAGTDTEYVSILDLSRERLSAHPWALTGGGAVELAALINDHDLTLDALCDEIGRTTIVGEDDAWIHGTVGAAERRQADAQVMPFVVGEVVRDYVIGQPPVVLWPYTDPLQPSWIS
jgi:hypothetical protein